MKPGAIIKVADGREGTVVYSGFNGYGFKWGRRNLTDEETRALYASGGDIYKIGVNSPPLPEQMDLEPDAMLCEKCRGEGVIDAAWSGSDPSCPDCGGEGFTDVE